MPSAEAPETGRGEDGLFHEGWNRGVGVDMDAFCLPGGDEIEPHA